jgi:hypothetical protein
MVGRPAVDACGSVRRPATAPAIASGFGLNEKDNQFVTRFNRLFMRNL